jgi:hypothetical protein
VNPLLGASDLSGVFSAGSAFSEHADNHGASVFDGGASLGASVFDNGASLGASVVDEGFLSKFLAR